MNAPDLRPNQPDSAAAPMETGQDHQLTHLFGKKRDEIVSAFSLSPALLQPDSEEPLAKVLPAGGPLQPRKDFPEWECSGCGLRSTTPSLPRCLHGHNNCPMVARP